MQMFPLFWKRKFLICCLVISTSYFIATYVINASDLLHLSRPHMSLWENTSFLNRSPKTNHTDTVNSKLHSSQEMFDQIAKLLSSKTTPERNNTNSPKLVLILAYMHTGSSYVGSVFMNHPDSFYWYEALRSLQDDTRLNQTIMYLNGTTRKLSGTYVDSVVGSEAASNMFKCRHDQLDITTLAREFYKTEADLHVLRDTIPFFNCQGRPKWRDKPAFKKRNEMEKSTYFTSYSKSRILRCLPHIQNKCNEANVRVLKFIRMTMETGEKVLKMLPDLKIIYLVRDPRAMLDSQVRKNDYDARLMPVFTKETVRMCTRMLEDLQFSNQIKMEYPERIMRIRYENIVEEPLEAAQTMFKFIGLPFTEMDEDFVRQVSIKSSNNSTKREALWRTHLDQVRLSVIDTYCSQVYKELGYLQYDRIEDIRKSFNPTYNTTGLFSNLTGF